MRTLLYSLLFIVLGVAIVSMLCAPTTMQQTTRSSHITTASLITRISQLDGSQYGPRPLDITTWWSAACSAAAMTEVMNAWGNTYRIRDILKVEVQLGVITPHDGLLETVGIAKTVQRFGFTATTLSNGSLGNVIDQANRGHPILINIPPSKAGTLYPGGHFLVVEGGTGKVVYTADSSKLNLHTWSRRTLLSYYAGLAIDIEPAPSA